MSQLIQMRHRIKSIETIKKVTHAMRLISMSGHAHLQQRKVPLDLYAEELKRLLGATLQTDIVWQHKLFQPPPEYIGPHLMIIVGSQKSLCGMFNTNVLAFLKKELQRIAHPNLEVITVGKKTDDYVRLMNVKVVARYTELIPAQLINISHELLERITNAPRPYAYVSLISSSPKSFFAQIPQLHTLIPFTLPHPIKTDQQEFIFEQDPAAIIDFLAARFLFVRIHSYLLQSLIAEQAARFVAMDSATRNATTMLDDMKLDYNKLRQARITRELTDLIGGL